MDTKELVDMLADAMATIEQIEELSDDLVLEFTANIPLGPSDREWDPNDEFKRCAIDRRERVVRYKKKMDEILENTLAKDDD